MFLRFPGSLCLNYSYTTSSPALNTTEYSFNFTATVPINSNQSLAAIINATATPVTVTTALSTTMPPLSTMPALSVTTLSTMLSPSITTLPVTSAGHLSSPAIPTTQVMNRQSNPTTDIPIIILSIVVILEVIFLYYLIRSDRSSFLKIISTHQHVGSHDTASEPLAATYQDTLLGRRGGEGEGEEEEEEEEEGEGEGEGEGEETGSDDGEETGSDDGRISDEDYSIKTCPSLVKLVQSHDKHGCEGEIVND